MNSFDLLALKQLDERTVGFKKLLYTQPKEGWIRLLRSVLSMPAIYLSKKIGVSQATLSGFEKSEKERTISLGSLDKIADALDCKVVYGFVPKDSYEAFVRKEEVNLAKESVNQVQQTMSLEDQALSESQKAEQEKVLLEDIRSQPLKKLWK